FLFTDAKVSEPKIIIEIIEDMHSIITRFNLKGIEIYIHMENLLRGLPCTFMQLSSSLGTMFFLKTYKKQLPEFNYKVWQKFSDVIYFMSFLITHYRNEKELFLSWDCQQMEWY
ncbi:MAG: hypothetical protein IJR47_01755, partial [Clostridia bacterium]|nr:hypothetical protein [Clostridia bacterium]